MASRIEHETPLANAAQTATSEANRNARAAMRMTVTDLPNDKFPLRTLLTKVLDANGALAGPTYQKLCGRIVESFDRAVADRPAFAVFFAPNFLDRLWPLLEAEFESEEYLDSPRARSANHLISMLFRAKLSAEEELTILVQAAHT